MNNAKKSKIAGFLGWERFLKAGNLRE